MQMIQTELASGNSRMVCWLARDARVKVGTVISLAKSAHKIPARWRVVRQYGVLEQNEIRRGWPAGGL